MKKLLSMIFALALLPVIGWAQSSISLNGVRIQSDGTNVVIPALKVSSFSSGLCLQTSAGGLLTTTAGACGTSSGTVTVTGTPISGNIGFFSGGTSVTNGNLTGDVTTSGTNVTTVGGLHFGATGLSLGTAPSSGQCLEYNGTNITGIGCGGSGTVTTASSGNLAPLFTSSVATPSTTPAISYTLSNASAFTLFGNNTGLSAGPAYVSMDTLFGPCSGATNALTYNTTTHAFGCNNITGTAAASFTFGATTIPLSSTAPTTNQCLSYDGTKITSAPCTPGTSTPGGASTAVQFNSTGTFGGDATNFSYNPASHSLAVTGALSAQQIGHTFYAEDFTGATASAQIQACLNALTSSDICVAKGLSGTALAQINVPSNTHLVMVGNSLAFSGTGLSIGASTNVLIEGDSTQQITSSVASGVSITTGSHIVIRDLVVNGYNSANTTGNAGFFIFGAASDVVFEHDTAQNGNGQCFRMDSASGMPSNVWIDRSSCISTAGASSEGIGPMGNNIWITNNYIYKVNVTGILVYNGRSGTWNSIVIKGNSIGDSSFSNGGNAAIQINPTSNGLKNIVIEGNSIWDDQGTPTTEVPISVTNGGSTGNITGLKISGNTWTNTIEQFEVSNSVAAAHLIDSSWDETTIGAPSGVCATGSTDRNLTGGSNTTFYVCQSNGWVPALGLPNTITTVGTTAIAANTCTTATTVTMTGLAAGMTLNFTPTADTSGVTGWGSTGGLVITAWPTTNTANYRVCNQTTASITPSASVSFNISAR